MLGFPKLTNLLLALTSSLTVTKEDLLSARDKIDSIINEKNCGPSKTGYELEIMNGVTLLS